MAWDDTNSLANTINGAGDRVRGSLQGLYEKQAQNREGDRALHPATQKWLQKVISGEMSPADAAVAAHDEIDADNNGIPDRFEQGPQPSPQGGGMSKLQDEEQGGGGAPQGMLARAQPTGPANLTPEAAQMARGGGMEQRPMTQRDLSDARGVSQVATPFVRADAQRDVAGTQAGGRRDAASITAGGRTDVANINNAGAGGRQDKDLKFKEKQLKEKGKEFDVMMKYRYDALDSEEDRIAAQIRSRESIAYTKQGNQEAVKLLQEDVKLVKEWSNEIARLQQEKTRAGGMLEPEQAAASDKMIRDLQKKVEHLNFSIDVQMRQRGGRGGLNAEPGSGGDTYPKYSPGTSGQPPSNMRRANPDRPPMPNLETSVNVKDPMALPDRQDASTGQVQMVWIKDNTTGAQVKVPASEVEADLRQMGAAKWRKRYTPVQRDD